MSRSPNPLLRERCIIAHVDHGKTSSSTPCCHQSGTFARTSAWPSARWNSNELERERASRSRQEHASTTRLLINIVDTPGHAEFGASRADDVDGPTA